MSNFETKEQYLKFITAWKKAANAEECKSKRVVCDHVQYYWPYPGFSDEEKARFKEKGYTKISDWEYTIPGGGHRKEPGWLNAEHYIFYNIMRGKNPLRGFYPKSARKIIGYGTPWISYLRALWKLESAVSDAKFYMKLVGEGKKPQCGNAARDFLAPFCGDISMEALLKIDKEELANARKFPI